jgi:hypothetical protein
LFHLGGIEIPAPLGHCISGAQSQKGGTSARYQNFPQYVHNVCQNLRLTEFVAAHIAARIIGVAKPYAAIVPAMQGVDFKLETPFGSADLRICCTPLRNSCAPQGRG